MTKQIAPQGPMYRAGIQIIVQEPLRLTRGVNTITFKTIVDEARISLESLYVHNKPVEVLDCPLSKQISQGTLDIGLSVIEHGKIITIHYDQLGSVSNLSRVFKGDVAFIAPQGFTLRVHTSVDGMALNLVQKDSTNLENTISIEERALWQTVGKQLQGFCAEYVYKPRLFRYATQIQSWVPQYI
ncbi:MAG: hypothetical protein AABX52_03460 [Nanoarchaeota archaeon]